MLDVFWRASVFPSVTLSRSVQAKFRVNHHCKVLCRIASLNKAQEKAFKSRISDEYRVNMYVWEILQIYLCV